MRLSADKTDRGFNAEFVHTAIIYLDGVRQSRVRTADEEEGTIERYAVDDDGKYLVSGDELVIEMLRGRVVIVRPER